MSAAYICDRCKLIFPGSPESTLNSYFDIGNIDLCKDCLKEFINKFLKKGK